jgi:hypothetical protein
MAQVFLEELKEAAAKGRSNHIERWKSEMREAAKRGAGACILNCEYSDVLYEFCADLIRVGFEVEKLSSGDWSQVKLRWMPCSK